MAKWPIQAGNGRTGETIMAMRHWARIGLGAALVLGAGQAAAAQPSDAKVRELMDLLGVGRGLSQMNSQMEGMMGQRFPCVPAGYWQKFMQPNDVTEISNRMAALYQQHFTAEEVDTALKFYRSPVGQKFIAQMPTILAEGAQIGQQWGQARGQAMLAQLQKQGTIDAQGRCPAGVAAPKLGK
jgi:hypothetical protein